jgi:hypothetical protein
MDIKELIEGTMEDYWGRFDRALEGLTREEFAWRPQAECNSIGFIAWHMGHMFRQLFGELNQHLGQVSYLRGMIKGFSSQRRLHTPA